ncbi:MAG: nucleotide sugar dehydrogenase [Chloroflexota bacterium]
MNGRLDTGGHERRFDVLIVGGFGHVGLPLGITFADAGLRVALYDTDASRGAVVARGEMPFIEHDAEPILRRVLGRTLHIVSDLSTCEEASTIVITVGTPVDEYLNPEFGPILQLADDLCRHLRNGHCIILRSTVFPGTTERLSEFLRERGLAVDVAYCPERIVQGLAVRELRTLVQITSGFSPGAVECARQLFKRLGVETIEVSVQEAELAKLFSNAWRYIQFAITNQFYMIATAQGASYENIYRAMTYNYPRAQAFPLPGFAAGPCLLKDTLQLAAFYENHFQLGHAAMAVNEGLPNFIVGQLRAGGVTLSGARVGILGMAFKAEIDDTRDSLSYKLAKVLRFHGATVLCSDEYVRDPKFVSKEDLLETCAVVIVGVPHRAYKGLTVRKGAHAVDLWGILTKESNTDAEAIGMHAGE